jgi:hypothetical protein
MPFSLSGLSIRVFYAVKIVMAKMKLIYGNSNLYEDLIVFKLIAVDIQLNNILITNITFIMFILNIKIVMVMQIY